MDNAAAKSVYVDAKYRIMEIVSVARKGNKGITFRAKKSSYLLIRRLIAVIIACHALGFLGLILLISMPPPMWEEPGLWWRIAILVFLIFGPNFLFIKRVFKGTGSVSSLHPKEVDGLSIWEMDEGRVLVEFASKDSMDKWFQIKGIKVPRCSARWQPSIIADIHLMLSVGIIALSVITYYLLRGSDQEPSVLGLFASFGVFICLSAALLYYYYWSSKHIRALTDCIRRFLDEIKETNQATPESPLQEMDSR